MFWFFLLRNLLNFRKPNAINDVKEYKLSCIVYEISKCFVVSWSPIYRLSYKPLKTKRSWKRKKPKKEGLWTNPPPNTWIGVVWLNNNKRLPTCQKSTVTPIAPQFHVYRLSHSEEAKTTATATATAIINYNKERYLGVMIIKYNQNMWS